MTFAVARYTADEWMEYSDSAHRLVFKESRNPELDRISFALLAHNQKSPVGYVTCREIDADSLYWQYGGAMDEFKGFNAVRAFKLFFDYCKERYKRITTLVKNDNVQYLHLLMKMGFRAIGIRCFANEIYLEMFWGEQ